MISCLMTVYNESVFLKSNLEAIQPYCEEIILVEGSWKGKKGSYDYKENKSSNDGTREIVEEFRKRYKNKVILLDAIGDENVCLNLGLSECSQPWVFHIGADEFYYQEDLKRLRDEILPSISQDIDSLTFDSMNFYFNFQIYMIGVFQRVFRNDGTISFHYGQCVGDVLLKEGMSLKTQHIPLTQFHFQWVGNRSKVTENNIFEREKEFQKLIGEDSEKQLLLGSYRWWYQEVFQKFNGSNLEELEDKCKGSIHMWSYHHAEHRNHKCFKISDEFVWPGYFYASPWFNPKEVGRISSFKPDGY